MTIVSFLITLLVIALIFWALRTILQELGLPEKLNRIIYVILVVLVVLWLVNTLAPGALPAFR